VFIVATIQAYLTLIAPFGLPLRPHGEWPMPMPATMCFTSPIGSPARDEALCWSHAWRKFFVLADIAPKARWGKTAPPISPIAFEAVMCDIEHDILHLAAEQRLAVRTKGGRRSLTELEQWIRG